MDIVIGIVVGVALGAAVGWFAGRSGSASVRAELSALQGSAAAGLDQERIASAAQLEQLRQQHAQQLADERAAAQRATEELVQSAQRAGRELLDAKDLAHSEQLATERTSWEARLEQEKLTAASQLEQERRSAATQLETATTALREQLALQSELAATQLKELQDDRKRLSDEFEALSQRVLKQSQDSLLELADQRFKRSQQAATAELATREQAVKSLVEPIQQTLAQVKTDVSTAEKSRLEAQAALRQQLETMQQSSEMLRSETSQLVTALRSSQVRGRWGELQLRRIVEVSGMLPHVDFDEQVTAHTDDGKLRPDMVVHLPGNKDIVVDAKVSLQGFLDAIDARDESVRNQRLDAHVRHVRTHIDQLGAKSYWDQFASSPEFVVMFLPAENFLQAALERDPDLLEHSFTRNVVIATPATLVALLRTVGYTWRQEQLASNAQQIFSAGRELHKRLATMGTHLTKMSKKLNETVEAFNQFNSSLDRNVVTQARRFSELQGIETALTAHPPLEVQAIPAHKHDVYESAGELGSATHSSN